jgi:hypothetical protein
MTAAFFFTALAVAVCLVGVAAVCRADPAVIDRGSLDTHTPEYWRRLARHERGTR